MQASVTVDNYRELLTPLLTAGDGQGFCVNLSVDTSSLDVLRLCRELDVLYIDTVVEPWPGFYYDTDADNATRTNQALRDTVVGSAGTHRAAPRRCRAVARTRGWCRGS